MTNRQIEHRIEEINAMMTMENMPLTKEDKQNCRNVLTGKCTTEDIIKKLNHKYQR